MAGLPWATTPSVLIRVHQWDKNSRLMMPMLDVYRLRIDHRPRGAIINSMSARFPANALPSWAAKHLRFRAEAIRPAGFEEGL
jgi:hypothetical protein